MTNLNDVPDSVLESIVSFVTGSDVVALIKASKQYTEKLVSGDSAWRTWMNIVRREVGTAAFRAMTGEAVSTACLGVLQRTWLKWASGHRLQDVVVHPVLFDETCAAGLEHTLSASRSGHSTLICADVLLAFAGLLPAGTTNALTAIDLASQQHIKVQCDPASIPSPRLRHTWVELRSKNSVEFSPTRQCYRHTVVEAVLFGGYDFSGDVFGDLYSCTITVSRLEQSNTSGSEPVASITEPATVSVRWTPRQAAGATVTARCHHSAVAIGDTRKYLCVFGGENQDGPIQEHGVVHILDTEAWIWHRLPTVGCAYRRTLAVAAAYRRPDVMPMKRILDAAYCMGLVRNHQPQPVPTDFPRGLMGSFSHKALPATLNSIQRWPKAAIVAMLQDAALGTDRPLLSLDQFFDIITWGERRAACPLPDQGGRPSYMIPESHTEGGPPAHSSTPCFLCDELHAALRSWKAEHASSMPESVESQIVLSSLSRVMAAGVTGGVGVCALPCWECAQLIVQCQRWHVMQQQQQNQPIEASAASSTATSTATPTDPHPQAVAEQNALQAKVNASRERLLRDSIGWQVIICGGYALLPNPRLGSHSPVQQLMVPYEPFVLDFPSLAWVCYTAPSSPTYVRPAELSMTLQVPAQPTTVSPTFVPRSPAELTPVPEGRVRVGFTSLGLDHLLVYGGDRELQAEGDTPLLADAWVLDLRFKRWHRLNVKFGSSLTLLPVALQLQRFRSSQLELADADTPAMSVPAVCGAPLPPRNCDNRRRSARKRKNRDLNEPLHAVTSTAAAAPALAPAQASTSAAEPKLGTAQPRPDRREASRGPSIFLQQQPSPLPPHADVTPLISSAGHSIDGFFAVGGYVRVGGGIALADRFTFLELR